MGISVRTTRLMFKMLDHNLKTRNLEWNWSGRSKVSVQMKSLSLTRFTTQGCIRITSRNNIFAMCQGLQTRIEVKTVLGYLSRRHIEHQLAVLLRIH